MQDETHIYLNAIRQALANKNAAIMVGAGFSRNAEGGQNLAMWPKIAEALSKALNPNSKEIAFSSGQVLRLAEEYVQVHHKPALENLLKEMIPDDKVTPGELHRELLHLPWSEIFTTNYDTLLERAAEPMIDQAHYTVCCREDIPASKIFGRRRIVKLHGSFPSMRPFVFTEEDYRKYPKDFAPFVNLVQQSLLENVFCLIGFSGDDPNFLYWIGWVRDMLEKHAHPIYLFLAKAPTLGERRLLESRNVRPVVLPLCNGYEEEDYKQRYLELFRILAKPLEASEDEWGTMESDDAATRMPTTLTDGLPWLQAKLPSLVALRKKYPGWLVAPKRVRQKFASTLNSCDLNLLGDTVYTLLSGDPYAVVALFEQHLWQQDVLLAPIFDNTAELALKSLLACSPNKEVPFSDANALLAALGVTNQREFKRVWQTAAIGLLRWARQELRREEFNQLSSLLNESGSNDNITDEIEHETILRELYLGNIEVARRRLMLWQPTSFDPYMMVRKGALLTEVGEDVSGLNVCIEAIKHIRAAQKIGRGKTYLLSLEAWGCLIAQNMQQVRSWSVLRFSDEGKSLAIIPAEHLSERLNVLSQQGYDVKQELAAIIAMLDSEVPPPAKAKSKLWFFDLGCSQNTTRIGGTSGLNDKMDAASAWLSIVERVSWVPRIGAVRFYTDVFMQSAWWCQYNNTQQRVLSIVVRVGYEDAFKPKDKSTPSYKTGWLSRVQIARISSDAALDVCLRSLAQVEVSLDSIRSSQSFVSICKFHAELFSRLVLRVEDEVQLASFIERLVSLHKSTQLQENSSLWEACSNALSRSIEALPTAVHARLIPQLLTIPLLPIGNLTHYPFHFLDHWANWTDVVINSHVGDFTVESIADRETLQNAIKNLISDVKLQPTVELSDIRRTFAWRRLYELNQLRLINTTQQESIGKFLWGINENWPVMPNFLAVATKQWPLPSGIDVQDKLRTHILSVPIAGFLSVLGSIQISSSAARRSWSISANNQFFDEWIASQKQDVWPVEQVAVGLNLIKRWWDAEWNDIAQDLTRFDELRMAVASRLSKIDEIFFLNSELLLSEESHLDKNLRIWLFDLINTVKLSGFSLWNFQLRQMELLSHSEDKTTLHAMLCTELLGVSEDVQLGYIYRAVRNCLETSSARVCLSSQIFDAVFIVIASRHTPSLWHCLSLAEVIFREYPEILSESRLLMLATGMGLLETELSYQNQSSSSNTPDELVPLLRYHAAKLAFSARQNVPLLTDAKWVCNWIDSAENDPLPELRWMLQENQISNSTLTQIS